MPHHVSPNTNPIATLNPSPIPLPNLTTSQRPSPSQVLQSRRPVSRSFLEPCRPSPTHRAHVLWQKARAKVSSLGKAGEGASAEEHGDGGVSGGDDVAPPSGKQVLELQAVQWVEHA